MKAEFFRGWSRGGDELFDGFEDELELLVVVGVFFFEGFDFLGEEGIGVHQPPELDEGAHDRGCSPPPREANAARWRAWRRLVR